MKRLTKIFCQISWDSNPGELSAGYIHLSCEGGLVKCEDEPVTVKYCSFHVEVQVGRGTHKTAVISNKTWKVLQDCNGGRITDAAVKDNTK